MTGEEKRHITLVLLQARRTLHYENKPMTDKKNILVIIESTSIADEIWE